MSKGVSIIICCYNSAERLPKTLEYLALQDIPSEIKCEIIIVDNASTDETKSVVLAEWEKYNLTNVDFRVVDQPIPGLTFARRKGFEASKYDYLILCDDDNWLDSKYISIAWDIMESDEKIGVMGGQGEAISDVQFPEWFNNVKGDYAVGKQRAMTGDSTAGRYLWGAGMVLRKKVILEILNSEIITRLTDRTGTSLSSGGDAEISSWYILAGFKLWYDERLKFFHYIQKERLTFDYYNRLKKGLEESDGILNTYFTLIKYVNAKHFGRLDFLYGHFIFLRIFYYRLSKRKFNSALYINLFKLYTSGIYRFRSPLINMAKEVLPRISKVKASL